MKIIVNNMVFDTERDAIALVFDTDAERKKVAADLTNMPEREAMRQYFTAPDSFDWDEKIKEAQMDINELMAKINWSHPDISRHTKNTSTCLLKADALEPIFVLRAKDPLAAILVGIWREMNIAMNIHEVFKTQGADEVLHEMIAWRLSNGLPVMPNPYTAENRAQRADFNLALNEAQQEELFKIGDLDTLLPQSKKNPLCAVLTFMQLPGCEAMLQRLYKDYGSKPLTEDLIKDMEMCVANWLCLFIERGEMHSYENFKLDVDPVTGRITDVLGEFHVFQAYAHAWIVKSRKLLPDEEATTRDVDDDNPAREYTTEELERMKENVGRQGT